MPKRQDIQSILIIGAGPIIIGQACEFDYSGAQACKALREEGYRVILVNSNPATIMTDPNMADATYIEPITWQTVEKIIAKEKPNAILPTMGGQTALNCALDLAKYGVLKKYHVELIGAQIEAIDKAEDRQKFKQAMTKIGLDSALSGLAHSWEEAQAIQLEIAKVNHNTGYPIVVRPSFTLGGTGGGIAYNKEEFEEICRRGLDLSPTGQLLIEESLLGWKEYEMEVIRDKNDNCIIVCSIENLDPMGVHTGDSITIAPAQTLTDKEYQIMRNASLAVLREIGVETGGSNVQYAINPKNGRMIVIEMNPRVSRSSALASKATGFPIAKIAAKLAIGYTLDELVNDITASEHCTLPASFEPSIDYIVTKIPRFAFEKFKQADNHLGTQMKSVGEAMAMGRTFQESLQKAMRSLEIGIDGFVEQSTDLDHIIQQLKHPKEDRLLYVADAMRCGLSLEDIHQYSSIDAWFLVQIKELIDLEALIKLKTLQNLSKEELYVLKQKGFADSRIANLLNIQPNDVTSYRHALNIRPVYKRVDTCAGEFSSSTAYLYSSYDTYCEAKPSNAKKIMILGGGPNRIGQGIEFDYCCVHAALALSEDGYETIMVNCNPETVSTDYDTSDRLYFEPLTLEDVLEIIHIENPMGVIVQYGGQTPLKLALSLEKAGVNIIGTSASSIDMAEDREHFQKLLNRLNLKQPPNRTARTEEQALNLAQEIGYPLVVRPSYVLGGRAMEIVHNDAGLKRYMQDAVKVSHDSPVLLDRFLDDAIECDVDCIADGETVYIAGVMEHIEQAGVHSGDSACSLPPYRLPQHIIDDIKVQTKAMAQALNVIGLMNVQFAVQLQNSGEYVIYVLEVNPRASRTVPFVSKAIGLPLAKIAARVMAGQTLKQQGITQEITPKFFNVKESVFPFSKFPGVDPILGPEMRSTGEVMGIGKTFGEALYKSQLAASSYLPSSGNVFISVKDAHKPQIAEVAKELNNLGYKLFATKGTASYLSNLGIAIETVNKVKENRPHIVDQIKNGDIQLIFTTVDETASSIADSRSIRTSAIAQRVSYYTTISGMKAAVEGIKASQLEVYCLQQVHAELTANK